MHKILLYYKFAPVADPEAVRLWQRTLCEKLGLKGRILISEHGINGTLGGDTRSLKTYASQTKTYPAFKDMVFKWSDGTGEDFPKLSVRVRPEIVTFGVADRLKVSKSGIEGGGQRLKPHQLHELIAKRGDDVVFFDGRNAHEAAIGKFKKAITPDTNHTRDFAAELRKPKYEAIKHKPVVTYCTGGIRCEVLSMLMKDEGFTDVYQIDGGIVNYGEAYGDDGLWEGALYVFDGRVSTKFSDKAKDIGACSRCSTATSQYHNCQNKLCNQLILVCDDCSGTSKILCSNCVKDKVHV